MSDTDEAKQGAARRPRRNSSEEEGEQDDVGTAEGESRVCMPCHGSGKVISNLGGEASEVTCPWCRGGGERLSGADAQEFHAQQAAR
jgi:DnaJ-class molecular chaperone